MTKTLFLTFVFGWLALAGRACGGEDARLLNGFNTDADIKLWKWSSTTTELTAEHVTEGDHAVKVTFDGSKNDYPGFSFNNKEALAGWEKFDLLAVDVFNPGDKPVSIGVRIDDNLTRVGTEDEYTTWYNGGWKALPGKNHFEIELAKMRTPSKRLLNKDQLVQFIAFVHFGGGTDRKPVVLFLDNCLLKKAAAGKLPDGMLGFDFGTPDSPCWPGFTRVTKDAAYSDAAGFGFGESGSREHRDQGAPDALGRDYVFTPYSGGPMVFSVKLAAGTYRVWALVGDLSGNSFPRKPFSVKVQGQPVFAFKPKSDTYMGSLNYLDRDYRRNASLFDLYVADRFSEVAFETECKGGKLDVAFEPGSAAPLCALVVWPSAKEEGAKFIAELNAARKDQFNNAYREIKPARLPEPPALTPEETERGFMLAYRNYLEEITPYFVPTANDRLTKLSIAAAPGQREPAVFIVYPTRDQAGLSVAVSDLKDAAGKSIPAANVKIERMVYRHDVSGDACIVKPGHLAPRATVDVELGVARQFWLTVLVPEDAAAGKYSGTVTVSAGGKQAIVPLELEVYPFKLEAPDVTYAHVYGAPNDAERIAMDLRCIAEHGFNSATPNIPGSKVERVGGKLKFDFELADLLMDKMKQAGMTGPVPLFNMSIQGDTAHTSYPHMGFLRAFGYKISDQAYLDDLTELTKQILEHAQEKNWLPVIMYPSTEISNDSDLGPEFNRKLIQAIRKAGKVVCVSSVNRPRDVESVKDLDIIMYNGAVPINAKTIEAAHAAGCKLWYQNIGATRYNDGLFLLRTGAVGRRQWVLSWYAGDPYSDFDAGAYRDSSCYMFPSPEGTLPSVNLEWMRAGVDDYRYFLTLKRVIEKARTANKAAELVAEAQRAYDEMIATCPVEMDLNAPVGEDGFVVNEGFKDKDTFDRYRRRVAEMIIKLRAKMGE